MKTKNEESGNNLLNELFNPPENCLSPREKRIVGTFLSIIPVSLSIQLGVVSMPKILLLLRIRGC